MRTPKRCLKFASTRNFHHQNYIFSRLKSIEANRSSRSSVVVFFRTFLECTKRCECQVCQPMTSAHESVCCAEIGKVWQKVEDQRPDIQMKCITEYLGFQSTCLDVWVHETAY